MPDNVFLDVLPRFDWAASEAGTKKLVSQFDDAAKNIARVFGADVETAAKRSTDQISTDVRKMQADVEQSTNASSQAFAKMVQETGRAEVATRKYAEAVASSGAESSKAAAAYTQWATATTRATTATEAHTRALQAQDAVTAKLAAGQAEHQAALDASTSKMAAFGRAANTVGAVGLAAFGAAMFETTKQASEFQASQERLVTSAGEAQQNLGQVSQGVLDMAGQVGFSADALSKGMYTVESAGYRAGDSLTVMKAAAQLAKSENADLTTTTDAVTTALHDYHLGADAAADVSSKLVTAVSEGKTTVEEFAGSLHSVQPIAASLGININDLYGSLAAMTASGESADQSTQNMADALRHLASPTQQMSKNLSDVGLDARDLSQHLGQTGLAGTMQKISEAVLQHMGPAGTVLLDTFNSSKQAADDANKAYGALPPQVKSIVDQFKAGQIGASGFRKELGSEGISADARNLAAEWLNLNNAADGFNNKIKSGGSDVQTYTQALQGMVGDASSLNVALQLTGENAAKTNQNIQELADAHRNADGSVKGFNETQETLKQKLDEAKAGFGAATIEIGNNFIPIMTSVANVLRSTAEFLAQHKDLADALILAIGGIGAAWAAAKTVMVFDTIITGLGRLKTAITGVRTESDLANASLADASKAAAEGESGVVAAETAETSAVAKTKAAALEANTALTGAGAAAEAGEAGVVAAEGAEVTAVEGVTTAAGVASGALAGVASAAEGIMGLIAGIASSTAALVAAPAVLAYAIGQHPENEDKSAAAGSRAEASRLGAPNVTSDAKQNAMSHANSTVDRRGLNPGSAGEWVANNVVDRRGLIPGSAGEQVPAPTPPPNIDPSTFTPDLDAGGGGGGGGGGGKGGKGSKDTATSPDIDANLPFHPIDLNPADKPVNESLDEWIDSQKAVTAAMTEVDKSTLEMSKAQAEHAELVKKGNATQEEWNSNAAAMAKAQLDNQTATQNLTIAQMKAQADADKPAKSSGSGREGGGPTGTSILTGDFEFSPQGIAKYFTSFLVNLALGNPVGKSLAAKRGEDSSNPLYVSDVNGGRGRGGAAWAGPGDSGINSDAALLANVPSGHYTQAVHDLSKGLDDCSGAVGDLVKIMDGQPTGGQNLNTGNAASWLPAHGFLPGTMPGAFNVGYDSQHMQATLPGGTNFNWGSEAAAASGGTAPNTGAFDPAFTQHWYRPVGTPGDGSSFYRTGSPSPSALGPGPLQPAGPDILSDPNDLSNLSFGTGLGLPFDHNVKLSPDSFGPSPGAGAPSTTPSIPGAPGDMLANGLGGGAGAQAARRGLSVPPPAPPAAPPAPAAPRAPTQATSAGQQYAAGQDAGPGFSSSIGSTLAGVAGMMFPGAGAAAAPVGKLLDRTIGYIGQAAGIGVGGLMETFLPGGYDNPLASPSKSWIGKLALGFAGAHHDTQSTAGKGIGSPKDPNKPQDPADPNKAATPAASPRPDEAHQGSGKPPGPQGPLIGQQVINTTNGVDGGSVARDMNRYQAGMSR